MIPNKVKLVEVGPRDGLQNEKQVVATEVKIELIHRLQNAGLTELEVTSFVSPKWVAQMKDNVLVLAGIERRASVRYSALVPNMKGLEALLDMPLHLRPQEIVVFLAATESFSQKNINCSIAESLERIAPVVAGARAAGLDVRGTVSCSLGCPYEGEVDPVVVGRIARAQRELGVQHMGVPDTIGTGTPRKVQAVFEQVLQSFDLADVSGHFHDTYGQALANTLAALELGVATFDTSIAGLGGCPYAKGATGNVATEDVVYMLHGMGIETGIDLDALIDAGQFISEQLGRPTNSRAAKALMTKRLA
ncbi:MAG: hydroxymethylglutaryl-CoA lyase [Cytophagales bacterium]|nr:hydroxymethylglutaryl-CoA lyase [Cytophagales bacterium]